MVGQIAEHEGITINTVQSKALLGINSSTREVSVLLVKPQTYMNYNGGVEFQMQYGSIGWSVGATLGYAQAAKDKRVIACIGDGSFQVHCEEDLKVAIEKATGEKKDCLCFIEVICHKDDTSKDKLEWGSRVSVSN